MENKELNKKMPNWVLKGKIWDYIHDNHQIKIIANANTDSETAGQPCLILAVKYNNVLYYETINVKPMVDMLVKRLEKVWDPVKENERKEKS